MAGAFSVKKSDVVFVHPEAETPGGDYILTNIDQNFNYLITRVYCYKAEEGQEVPSESPAEVVKKGLEKALVTYYPFAGCLAESSEGKAYVKCTNQGVPFVEAEADCDLDTLGDITLLGPKLLGSLVHSPPENATLLESPLAAVQVTKFKCGGFVLGMVMNHVMFDGISALECVVTWSEITRGVPLSMPPITDRSLLKARDPPSPAYPHDEFLVLKDVSGLSSLYEKEPYVETSIEFDLNNISALKKLGSQNGAARFYTTFLVVTAMVWQARTRALNMNPEQLVKIVIPTDGRSKLANRQFPKKGYYGNVLAFGTCILTAKELVEKPLLHVLELLKNAVAGITEDYFQSNIDYIELNPKARVIYTPETILVTSWSWLPFNKADFGWGVPKQSESVALPLKSFVIFGSSGQAKQGANVVMGLPESAMNNFKELMKSYIK